MEEREQSCNPDPYLRECSRYYSVFVVVVVMMVGVVAGGDGSLVDSRMSTAAQTSKSYDHVLTHVSIADFSVCLRL